MAIRVAILSPYPTFQLHQKLGCRSISYENNASWTVTLADSLAQIPDTEVHILTEATDIPRTQTLRIQEVALHFIKAPDQFKALTLWHFDRARLHTALAEIRPDIVHGQGVENQYGDAAVHSCYPHLLTVHGIPRLSNEAHGLQRFNRARIVEYAGNRCLQAARNIVVINPFVAEYLQFNPARYRLFNIANPIAAHFFLQQPVTREPHLFLAVGWVDRLKAHDVLARALALLRRRGVIVQAKIIGPPPPSSRYFELLQKYIQTEHLDIEFLGFLPPEQVAGWMRRCTALVHPSRHDNAPMSICEAMACRTPVVATRVGGIGHLIRDGETGLLFEPANCTELADKLRLLLEDADLRHRAGENAHQHAQATFQPQRVADATRAAYVTVLSDSRIG